MKVKIANSRSIGKNMRVISDELWGKINKPLTGPDWKILKTIPNARKSFFWLRSNIDPSLLVKKTLFSVWSVFVETMMAKCICVYSAILNKETSHSFEHKLVLNFYLAEVNLAVCIQFWNVWLEKNIQVKKRRKSLTVWTQKLFPKNCLKIQPH